MILLVGGMKTIWSEIRIAGRRLARERLFTVTALTTLAVGIGANSAIFTLVNGVLLQPLPFSEPERLVMPHAVLRGQAIEIFSAPVFLALQAESRALSDVALVAHATGTLVDGGVPEEIPGAAISANYFDVVGVPPLRGRLFRAEENEPGTYVVLLSEGLWQQRFGGDEQIIGRTVELSGRPHEVVGIMPATASFPGDRRYWTPIGYAPGFRDPGNVLALSYQLVARMAPGVTVEQASADVARVVEIAKRAGDMDNPQYTGAVRPLRDVYVAQARMPLLVLLGAVGCVLLIVCANLANLLLAQAASRTTDFAVRRALGASPGQLIRQLMTESLVLGLAGGALGLLLGVWGAEALLALMPADVPRPPGIGVDGTVLLFTFGIALLSALIFGVAPAVHAHRAAVAGTLRHGGRGLAGRSGGRTRSALVLAETTLAFALVIGAGLLIRSLGELRSVDPGFRAGNALAYTLALPAVRYGDAERIRGFWEELTERTLAIPGVSEAGAVNNLPLGGTGMTITFEVEGRPLPPAGEEPLLQVRVVTPGYFDAMGIPLRRGRLLQRTDHADAPPVALLSEAAVAQQFPGEDPIGRRIILGFTQAGEPVQGEVVGIVGNVRHGQLRTAAQPEIYLAHAQLPRTYMSMVVRTDGDPAALAAPVTAAVHSIDPALAVSQLRTLQNVVAASVATDRFLTVLLTAFSVLALLLAAVGIFGVISYGVAQRRREIGVRLAVGASQGDVVRLVVGGAMRLAVGGMLIGLVAAVALTRLLQSLLYGVRPTDPLTFAAAAAVLLAVALAASLVPARRAARTPPASVLNAE